MVKSIAMLSFNGHSIDGCEKERSMDHGYYKGQSGAAKSLNRNNLRMISTALPDGDVAIMHEIAWQEQCSLAKVAKKAIIEFLQLRQRANRPEQTTTA
jgi:hypothetical protein